MMRKRPPRKRICKMRRVVREYACGWWEMGKKAAHVSEGEERTVKEEHDAEDHEERAERGQPDADF
jgi:hypothetical protein